MAHLWITTIIGHGENARKVWLFRSYTLSWMRTQTKGRVSRSSEPITSAYTIDFETNSLMFTGDFLASLATICHLQNLHMIHMITFFFDQGIRIRKWSCKRGTSEPSASMESSCKSNHRFEQQGLYDRCLGCFKDCYPSMSKSCSITNELLWECMVTPDFVSFSFRQHLRNAYATHILAYALLMD